MVELLSAFPSSRLGDVYNENACGDRLGSLYPWANLRHAHKEQQDMEGVEGPDGKLSALERYGEGTALFRSRQPTAQDPWFSRSLSEKHMHRRSGLQDTMERSSPADVATREKNVSVTRRAHVERLQVVDAVDKTEMEGAVDNQEKTTGRARSHWDFSGLPYSSTGSKRSMTITEVQLLQSIGQGVICTDLEGNITYWNRAAEAMYLWKAEEVLGRNVVQLLTPKKLTKESIEVIGKVSHGESWSGPYPALRKDGVIINTVVTDTPIVDSNNKIIGIIGVSFDVTTLPIPTSRIRRSHSDEGLHHAGEKERFPITGSDEGKNILSWRRVHLEAENMAENTPIHTKATAAKSSNLLSIGRSSVQQLLRKLQIGTGQRQDDVSVDKTERVTSWVESNQNEGLRGSSKQIPTGLVEHSQIFPVYVPNESMEADFGDRDGSSIPLVVPGRPSGRGDGWSWESSTSQKEVIKEVMSIAVPQPGTFSQTLSRSSSGSGAGSATGRDASSVGSPIERSFLDNAWNTAGASINFQRAEEDFQLQLALALRVAAEAAAVDDPDLSANVRGPKGDTRLMPGITKTEATAYRYWVRNCLSYDDRIEDGFFEIWGMSPYVWSMCTDSSELGRMPPLESLRAVAPSEATFEVVLVDRNMDPSLRELEDKAVGLAYDSTEVLDMASKLSIMVANVMGGAVASDEELMEAWQAASTKLMQLLGSIVLPIGVLRVGLSRHRALLFKVMADSVGLPCRLVRGSSYCGKEDDASVLVKCGDEREWMVDLLINPGSIMPPDKRLAAPPAIIPSPLQFERESPFGGTSVSVLHWTRTNARGKDGGNRGESPRVKSFPDAKRIVESPRRQYGGDNNNLAVPQSDGSRGGNNRGRESNQAVLKDRQGSARLLDRPELRSSADPQTRSPDVGKALFMLEDILKPPVAIDNKEARQAESPVEEGGRGFERYWAREERRPTGSDDSVKSGGAGRMLDQIALESSDFEIAWEDIVMGERIGQGSYGKVYRADWQGSDVAVKVFLDQDLKTEALEEFKSEVAIMRRLRHPNIVLFMGAVTKPPNLSIITEFCPRGSLYRLLHRPNRELDERKRIRMAVDVAKGMNYLHRCSPPVVHRDLKSPNLLVDKNWTVKVCDFGLSRQKHSTFLSSKSSAGTPEWMAPEVLRNEPSDEKSDVYSFGVILWELATLQVPWNGMNPIQVVGAVGFQHRRLPIPDHVERSVAAIIQACWRTDSKLRPSFADLMQELRNLQQRPLAGQPLQGSSAWTEQKEQY